MMAQTHHTLTLPPGRGVEHSQMAFVDNNVRFSKWNVCARIQLI